MFLVYPQTGGLRPRLFTFRPYGAWRERPLQGRWPSSDVSPRPSAWAVGVTLTEIVLGMTTFCLTRGSAYGILIRVHD
jgi:hypothetical protein